jgi:hypothetical protein
MAQVTMKYPVSLRITQPLYNQLYQHLFPGDGDEHGAVLTAGIVETSKGTRLLVRDVFLAKDGVDYVPSTRGYRALIAQFVADKSHYCATQNLCYFAVHCHGGQDQVAFSADDLASHERGYPALLDITKGGPIGALVFAKNAVAGDIWTSEGRYPLNNMVIIGSQIRSFYPSPKPRPRTADPKYDRHARMFGDVGQEVLSNLKVGIIGLGGAGSLINEWLSQLGVGHIVAIDFDRVEITNRPRIVGSTRWDAMEWLVRQPFPWVQRLGKKLAKHKVYVAQRVAKRANGDIQYDAIVGSIVDESVAKKLIDADFIFLAADTAQSRLVFNALAYQYLIPGVQVGVKVPVDQKTGTIGDIFSATRHVHPFAGGGCLNCHELISPSRLQEEALSLEERKEQQYINYEDIPQPSVITLNVMATGQAVNDFLMMFIGLFEPDQLLYHQMNKVRQRQSDLVEPMIQADCLHCSSHERSNRAKGDRGSLPCL